jgi:uncharacterized protein (DUF2147 family)
MKKLIVLVAMTLMADAAYADPVEGVWKTKPDDNGKYGYVEITPCGAKLCGVLIKAFDSTGAATASDNIGKQIVWDMVPAGDGSYSKGKVWAPDRDKTYNSKMALSGDKLAVSGCVLGGIICRASDWMRVK